MKNIAVSLNSKQLEILLEHAENKGLDIEKVTLVKLSYDYSAGEIEDFSDTYGVNVDIKELKDVNWDSIDIYFYNDKIEHLTAFTVASANNVVCIDVSGQTAALNDMPVIIPGLDTDDLELAKEKGMLALPETQVLQMYMILYPLVQRQNDLIVSATSLVPVSYGYGIDPIENINDLIEDLKKSLNFTPLNEHKTMAFNVLTLRAINSSVIMGFDTQLLRLLPQVSFAHVHSLRVPTMSGIVQQVTVSYNAQNHWEPDIIANWKEDLKNNRNISIQEEGFCSQREFISNENALLCVSDIFAADKVTWKSVADSDNLQMKLAVEAALLMINENNPTAL